MGKFINLTGKKFHYLKVISRNREFITNNITWLCKCKCSNIVIIKTAQLKSGHTKSCGCYQKERVTKHGNCKRGYMTPEYRAWRHMKHRCYNPDNPEYHNYGERGIKVCKRWHTLFDNFLEDMGNKPFPHYQIDRIDNNGHYTPSNTRWASPKTNSNNKRNNVFIEFNEHKLTIPQWSRKLNINKSTLWKRIYILNWPLEKVFSSQPAKSQF